MPARQTVTAGKGQVCDDVFDDEAEAERHDGQIVAAQTQRRNAHEQTQQSRKDSTKQTAAEHDQNELAGAALDASNTPARSSASELSAAVYAPMPAKPMCPSVSWPR